MSMYRYSTLIKIGFSWILQDEVCSIIFNKHGVYFAAGHTLLSVT